MRAVARNLSPTERLEVRAYLIGGPKGGQVYDGPVPLGATHFQFSGGPLYRLTTEQARGPDGVVHEVWRYCDPNA